MCSQHFTATDYIEGSSCLKVSAVPSCFQENRLRVTPQRLSAFERASIRQGAEVHSLNPVVVENVYSGTTDQDYTETSYL